VIEYREIETAEPATVGESTGRFEVPLCRCQRFFDTPKAATALGHAGSVNKMFRSTTDTSPLAQQGQRIATHARNYAITAVFQRVCGLAKVPAMQAEGPRLEVAEITHRRPRHPASPRCRSAVGASSSWVARTVVWAFFGPSFIASFHGPSRRLSLARHAS